MRIRDLAGWRQIAAFGLWALLAVAPWARAAVPWRPTVLDAVPAALPVPVAAAGIPTPDGPLPAPFREAVRRALEQSGGVLLVGRTDAVGPRELNRALGLEYARAAAFSLAQELAVSPGRFGCASAGETGGGAAGVVAVPWPPPELTEPESRPVALLLPAGDGPARDLWAVWAAGGRVVFSDAVEGGVKPRVPWQVPAPPGVARLPLSARTSRVAVAAGDRLRWQAAAVSPVPVDRDHRLSLSVATEGAWTVRLTGALPPGYTRPRVWAGGIPYPLQTDPAGRVDAEVVRTGRPIRAWLEADGPGGRPATGPPVAVGAAQGPRPSVLAVLVWEDGAVDLDLHLWEGSAHTRPGAPDPAFAPGAVPDTRVLLDGDGRIRASAVAVWGDSRTIQLEAWCFSGLGGRRTRAWVYAVAYPGDPVRERRWVYGPRWLSEAPLERRWPVLGFGGGVFSSHGATGVVR